MILLKAAKRRNHNAIFIVETKFEIFKIFLLAVNYEYYLCILFNSLYSLSHFVNMRQVLLFYVHDETVEERHDLLDTVTILVAMGVSNY